MTIASYGLERKDPDSPEEIHRDLDSSHQQRSEAVAHGSLSESHQHPAGEQHESSRERRGSEDGPHTELPAPQLVAVSP
jgi:hypothetical protein